MRAYTAWLCLWLAVSSAGFAGERGRQWTVYLAQDKHLDYNWCGSTTEIELRMATLLDYYVEAAERDEVRWNLDGTLWEEVYRRHRGDAGAARLHGAIRQGRIGYAGNYAVMLWGILDAETAIRACYDAARIEQATGTEARTALVMENAGLTWGAANVLTECGFDFLGRGVYPLRAESYLGQREPCPLFWWQAPNRSRILVRWDLYADTGAWGGYAEGFKLVQIAGEKWDAFHVQSVADRNSAEIVRKRTEFIRQTVERYEAYGARYPISSILLLGTGWDNWTQTTDLSAFIRKFNAASDGSVRIVDARYEDFFLAAEREIEEKHLAIPTLAGSFGICWEEWAAHLAGLTSEFREAQRLLRIAEAAQAIETMAGHGNDTNRALIRNGVTQLLKFAEHDFGGTDRQRAALSAGARASAVTQAMDIARALAPKSTTTPPDMGAYQREQTTFAWRGGRVVFDPNRCAVTHVADAAGRTWVDAGRGTALGEFVHTRYRSRAKADSVFPEVLPAPGNVVLLNLVSRRADRGVEIVADFERSGFRATGTWFFHAAQPWIDVSYRLMDGWSDDPQTVEFHFPFALDAPTYTYDAPGAILKAGPKQAGGDDLPGANPDLYAGVTFAAAHDDGRTALVVAPDSLLWRFGRDAKAAAQIDSMPMMNLTGNDWQFGQGGRRDWTFRYRIVLLDAPFDAVAATREAQQFASPPYLAAPGLPAAVSGLAALDIDFAAGPLLTFKVAEDDRRLILRFWNVLERQAPGSFALPPGWNKVTLCDALERPTRPLEAGQGRVQFRVHPLGIRTIALSRDR